MRYHKRKLTQVRAARKTKANHLINLALAYSKLNTWFPRSGYQHRLASAVGDLGRYAVDNHEVFHNYKYEDYTEDLIK